MFGVRIPLMLARLRELSQPPGRPILDIEGSTERRVDRRRHDLTEDPRLMDKDHLLDVGQAVDELQSRPDRNCLAQRDEELLDVNVRGGERQIALTYMPVHRRMKARPAPSAKHSALVDRHSWPSFSTTGVQGDLIRTSRTLGAAAVGQADDLGPDDVRRWAGSSKENDGFAHQARTRSP
jgi:hypothetical protein